MQFFDAGVLGAFDTYAQASSIALQVHEPIAEGNFCAVALRVPSEVTNQTRPLNNQIRTIQGNLGGAAVGEQFKFADFVDDRSLTDLPQQGAHVARHNERPGSRVKLVGPLEHFHSTPGPRKKRCCEKTGSGTANHGDLWSGFRA